MNKQHIFQKQISSDFISWYETILVPTLFSPAPNLLSLTHTFSSNKMSLSLCLSSGTGLKFHTEPVAWFVVADDLSESCSFSFCFGQGKFATEFSSTHHLL